MLEVVKWIKILCYKVMFNSIVKNFILVEDVFKNLKIEKERIYLESLVREKM